MTSAITIPLNLILRKSFKNLIRNLIIKTNKGVKNLIIMKSKNKFGSFKFSQLPHNIVVEETC